MNGPEVARRIAPPRKAEVLYDWAGGLVWAEIEAPAAGAAIVHRAVAATGGHATLIRAPAAVRAAVDVFDPQNAGVAMLSKRIKENFDPKGVLNPAACTRGCERCLNVTSFRSSQRKPGPRAHPRSTLPGRSATRALRRRCPSSGIRRDRS